MKMPTLVWKKLISIQRALLWGGVNRRRKISWVKWEVVCQPKTDGGLGVKDVRVMNLSLLAKWRWRILQYEESLRRDVITARYGEEIGLSADWMGLSFPSNSSNWWKDLKSIDEVANSSKWFSGGMVRKIGNGESTKFWHVKWIGDVALKVKFPRLFSLSEQKDIMISEVLVVPYNSEFLVWRRGLFQWEVEQLLQLNTLLQAAALASGRDKWMWRLEEDGLFKVQSAYNCLGRLLLAADPLPIMEAIVFNKIWLSPAPSKIIACSWQMLYDRLPSKQNLYIRGARNIQENQTCGWCENNTESGLHLLLHCNFAQSVWRKFWNWLRVDIIVPPNLFILFIVFMGGAVNNKMRKGLLLIWHSTMWFIWKARNGLIFNKV
jgi:hypothetical protein